MYPNNIIEILAKLEQTYWMLKQEISGLSEEQMHIKTDLNERTIFGILYHLDYHEQLYLSHYIRSFMYKKLTFNSFSDEESWNYWNKSSALEQLESFYYERKRNIELIKVCGKEVWERVGIHPKRGEIKLIYPINTTIEHDIYHIDHIHIMKKKIIEC